MLLFFLFFILWPTVFTAKEKHICTLNHTVELESDTVVFFESPNFPRYMTDIERDLCHIKFMKNLTVEEQDKRFVIAISNAICEHETSFACLNLYDSVLNFSSYDFRITVNDGISFQGFAYFDDWGDDCPLESVSRVDPFEFIDLNQVLVLRSAYDQSKFRNQSCLWQFIAPENYGFKIVVTNLNILDSTIFKISNIQDTIITAENVRIGYPHYSIDNYLKIYLSENSIPYSPIEESGGHLFEFSAYITIIQNFYHNNPFNCVTTIPSNPNSTSFWSYWNENGYPANAQYGEIDSSAIVFSTQDKNEREILWEFITDGSIQFGGFEMSFKPLYCSCADSIIFVPCEYQIEKTIMEGDEDFYCGNLNCNFTIKLEPSCKSDFIYLSILLHSNLYTLEDGAYENDVFKVISNNSTIFNIKHSDEDQNQYYFRIPASNDNIFQAVAAFSSKVRHLKLYFSTFNISTVLPPIIINETKPYHFHQNCLYNAKRPYMISVELSPDLKKRNATIEIFIFDKVDIQTFTFYAKNNLYHVLNFQDCFASVTDSVFKCKTNVSTFSMVSTEAVECNYYILFQVSKGENLVGSDGCMFKKNNAFNLLNYHMNEKVISVMSTKMQKYRIFGYSSNNIFITKIWKNPNSNCSINIYSGIEEKCFAVINTSSLSLWRNLFLSKNIYIVDIPINTTVMFTIKYKLGYDSNAVNITKNPFKTVITSPNYGNNAIIPYVEFEKNCYQSFNIFETTALFTVSNFDVSAPNYFYFLINQTQYINLFISFLSIPKTLFFNLTTTHRSFSFKKSDLKFCYQCSSNLNCNIRILVETSNLNESSTTLITTRINTSRRTTKQLQITTEKSFSFKLTINYLFLILGIGIFK